MRVQDLTAKDIEHYVAVSLRKLEFDSETSAEKIQDLRNNIVRRAEGAFLWAHLVVEHIRIDVDYLPTWTSLIQRVDGLPSGLHSMYQAMWERHNGDSELYRAETASYLNYLLASSKQRIPNILLAFMLRFSPEIQDRIFKGDVLSRRLIVEECSRFDTRIVARCGGLVAASDIPSPRMLPAYDEERTDSENRIFRFGPDIDTFEIKFGHQSAADFLLSTSSGHQILS